MSTLLLGFMDTRCEEGEHGNSISPRCGGCRMLCGQTVMLTPFERGLVAHLVADWLLQNDWMALNKGNLRHPAGWVHASMHGLLLGWALGWPGGVVLGVFHLLLDTGRPLDWWIRVFKKCDKAPQAALIRLWTDQVLHIAAIAAWVAFGLR